MALDEVRGWWRYHQLFADLLRARLHQERPGRVPGLHRAAAAWHEAHGLADEAVSHALAAGDTGWTARLVERHVEGLLRRSEGATLGRWLSGLPAEAVGSRARLCLAQAVAAVVVGQLEAVEPLLAAAERALGASGEEPHQPSVGRALSVLANVPASIAFLRAELARFRGDAERAVAFDRQALTQLGEGDWLLGSQVAWNLAGADWLRGRLARAEHGLAEVVAERQAAGEGFMAMLVGYDLGQVQRAQGRLGAALASYQRWLEPAGQPGRLPPHAGMAHVGVAEVLYERDQLDSAHEHATRGVALCRQLAFTQPLGSGLGMLARFRQAHGDAAGALEAIDQAQRVGVSPQVIALLNPVPVWRARLLLANGEVAEAARWAEGRGLRVTDEPSYPREGEYLVLARVLLAQQQPDPALGLLERLHAQAAAQGRTGSVIEVRALQALALHAAGDRAGALAALAQALTLGWQEDYMRVFVDEGAPMARLLARLAAAHRTGQATLPGAVPPGYLDRLAWAFQPGRARADPPTSPQPAGVGGLVEPLSDRELEVLGLLAAGRSNQQIADELVVVLDTVKKHVRSHPRLGGGQPHPGGRPRPRAGAAALGRRRAAPGPARGAPGGAGRFHPRVPFRVTPPGPAGPSLPGVGSGGPRRSAKEQEDHRWTRPTRAAHPRKAARTLEHPRDLRQDGLAGARHAPAVARRTGVLSGLHAYGNIPGGLHTGLALVGAYVLAGELARAGGDHPAAFAHYDQQLHRYARIAYATDIDLCDYLQEVKHSA